MDRVVEGKKNSKKILTIPCSKQIFFLVICGFCLLSLLMIGVFVYYLHKKNRKMATGQFNFSKWKFDHVYNFHF